MTLGCKGLMEFRSEHRFFFLVDIAFQVTSNVSLFFVSLLGVKALKDGFAISSSVDQRIVLWEIVDTGQVCSNVAE